MKLMIIIKPAWERDAQKQKSLPVEEALEK
jgi:hypothetical protein